MIAYTQCYSGLWRSPNIRAVLSLGALACFREMKLLLRLIYIEPGAVGAEVILSF